MKYYIIFFLVCLFFISCKENKLPKKIGSKKSTEKHLVDEMLKESISPTLEKGNESLAELSNEDFNETDNEEPKECVGLPLFENIVYNDDYEQVYKNILETVKPIYGIVTYDQPNRYSCRYDGVFLLDCSSFARYILTEAGLDNNFNTTADIFSNENRLTLSVLSELLPGDLIGWPPKYSSRGNGHVYVYVGKGVFVDVGSRELDGITRRGDKTALRFYYLEDLKPMIKNGKIKFWRRMSIVNYDKNNNTLSYSCEN